MIADLDEFKLERLKAQQIGTIEAIKSFAAKYGIKVGGSDFEVVERFKNIPEWD